ncbi:DNA-binding protein WhiA [Fusibacter tunisiensis]|uniref:Probable cell division protein WhiA n=1 Tax=Fusibacter tunisiensis TaxID=1008308 RepID=A0ABS2MRG3_9FIRM|nr:DNA-binding protein WhiA [Fusibacter tunisiensis]MBM7561975.1 DNA-binding protein WhiA [Fusibacter tunisiensis]
MSFSSKAKNELALIRTEAKCCNRAELSGIIRVSGALEFGGLTVINLRITTENPAVARLVFILLKKVYKLHSGLVMKENKMLNKHHLYEIYIEKANDILLDLDLLRLEGDSILLNDAFPEKLVSKKCCKKAYLRGVFLGGGSISAPEKSYHMELITHNQTYAEQLADFMNSQFNLGAKTTLRKKNYIVYLKESEKIVDFLNVIGAHKTLLDYENVRIIKQMRNNVNRVVNCETANLSKTIDAAYEQIAAIRILDDHIGLEALPERLREIARIRVDNPEASLKELGELVSPPIGKSGVNHRLKKILEMAEKYNIGRGMV